MGRKEKVRFHKMGIFFVSRTFAVIAISEDCLLMRGLIRGRKCVLFTVFTNDKQEVYKRR